MKTHWYIIILTIIIGLGMYYYIEIGNNKNDQINLINKNTEDFKIYVGDITDTIYFKDGHFSGQNNQIFTQHSFPISGQYSCTLSLKNTIIVTYKDKWFYDIPFSKNIHENGYRINIKVSEEDENSHYLETELKKGTKPFLLMNGYMMPMYDHFEMWIRDQQYRNIRVIEEPVNDSIPLLDTLTN